MKLALSGKFHQIAKFFNGVGQLDRIINIENISLKNPKVNGDEVDVDVECLATAFRSTKASDAAKRPLQPGARPAAPPPAPAPAPAAAPGSKMSTSSVLVRSVLTLGAAAMPVAAGCGGDAQTAPPVPPTIGGQTAPPTGGAPAPGAQAVAAPNPTEGMPPLPLKTFEERDFSETDQSRDPFRSFAGAFVTNIKTPNGVQRKTLVERYALDELKLIGIVTRGPARALLTDPSGLGWVAKIGDLVGKAELVHAGGPTGVDVAVNWRVDRIRPSDVVFIREDPSHPEIPPTTRVIALRTPEEEAGFIKR